MGFLKRLNFLRPPPPRAELSPARVPQQYKKFRLYILIGVSVGYASFYVVRNNFAFAIPYLLQEGLTKTQVGLIFSALPLAYGLRKFCMGLLSDYSNARYFMATGLLMSLAINMVYGSNLVLSNFTLMLILMFFNGWVQGMGWPALIRVIVHWFTEAERGTKMSIISIMQNVGCGIVGPLTLLGIMLFGSWHSIFYFPAMVAICAVILILMLVRDTPQSVGLPPIESYARDTASANLAYVKHTRGLKTKQSLLTYVLTNRGLWCLAAANIFSYLVRYGIINWAPTYLKEVKGFTHVGSSWTCFLYEHIAMPGIILSGWLSDKYFYGRRAAMGAIFMAAVGVVIILYWLNPTSNNLINNLTFLSIGFFVYVPPMIIGVCALDLVPKQVAGTAQGLVGFFAYLGTIAANAGVGWIVDNFGWDALFVTLLLSSSLAILFLIFALHVSMKCHRKRWQ